jgi:hypothetical protein
MANPKHAVKALPLFTGSQDAEASKDAKKKMGACVKEIK